MRIFREGIAGSLLSILMLGLGGCDRAPLSTFTTAAPPASPRTDYADLGFDARLNDWPQSISDEISVPDPHGDHPDAGGAWVCPEIIHRSITMQLPLGGGELATFEFTGDKILEGLVPPVYNPSGPYLMGYPHGRYIARTDAISDDARWIAVAPHALVLACRGQYVRTPGFIVWAGVYYPVEAEGEIRSGPNYACASGGGTGNPGDNTMTDGAYTPYSDISADAYDPYDATGLGSGDCTGGGDNSGPGGTTCTQEYAYLDQWINGEWVQIWEGWVSVCE